MAKLPQKKRIEPKICIVCHRPFEWRKKWEKNWDEVKYCSDKCRMHKAR
ncbi:MAG: DUF2256 domain-containing protein [Sphingomonadales bacterium]|nr:DUF2256 domain-containing protein [Sphingomonadales bacterium]